MPNLRIISANYADQATRLAASTTSGALAAALMQTDRKGEAHRSTGTSVTYTLTWTGGVSIGGVALPATNLTSAATMRVRLYDATSGGTLLLDTGTNTACPGLTAAPWTWTAVHNANAFAYGYASKAVAWFANTAGVKRAVIDLVDTGNPAGYIDCARVVCGPWWSPEWNAEYGCTTLVVDNTTNTRSDAGDLTSDRAPMHTEHTFNLPIITPADRSELMQIMRANGVWKPVFLSLMPSASSAAAEQDHMVFGKRKSSPISHPFFETYSHEMTLESW